MSGFGRARVGPVPDGGPGADGGPGSYDPDSPLPPSLTGETPEQRMARARAALAEAEAEYGEMAVNGWRMEGTPRVVGTPKATATRYREADALRVAACIDSSEVRLVDAQGRTVGAEPRERRALNLFTLVRDGDSWKVAERSLPAETACD